MSSHYKPAHDRPTRRRKSGAGHPVSDREARDAGRKLLLFAAAAIVVVLLGAWWMMRT